MSIYNSRTYLDSVRKNAGSDIPWDRLSKKTILLVGVTGLIGRYATDLLMYKNLNEGLGAKIIAASRNEAKARETLNKEYFDSEYFEYRAWDVSDISEKGIRCDYIVDMASNTHPLAYAQRPIETIITNIYGVKNLLDICASDNRCRFVLPSSVEIYGQMDSSIESYDETQFGYLDPNTVRAGYPESKRVCESLCQAYIDEKGIEAVIVRFPRVFGPTMSDTDSKAIAQFIRKASQREDIVLKSDGSQFYSFLYVADAVTGLLKIMLEGKTGEAYNLSDPSDDATLAQAASICAEMSGKKVVFELPDGVEKKGYSTATRAVLNGDKARSLGWKSNYSIREGLEETLNVLREK